MGHAWKIISSPWPGVRLQECNCGDRRLLVGDQIQQSAFQTAR